MCPSLENFTVDPDNAYYSSVDGVLFDKAQTELIRCPAAKTAEHFSVPNTVAVIDESAFQSCSSLESVVIPKGVTAIEDYAFENSSSLTSVTIPGSAAEIGRSAFYGCSSLTSVIIPASVTSIGYCSFYGCSSLSDVYYASDSDTRAAVSIDSFNYFLTNATIHYNHTPLSGTGVKASKSAAAPGESVTRTTAATGGTGTLKYCFYAFKNGTVIVRGEYGTAKAYTYTPAEEGAYSARVYVKDASGTAGNLTGGSVTSPITISSVKSNRVLTTVDDTITWTAAASGGDGARKYCFYVLRNGDVVERGSYGTAKTCSYTPASAGTCTVRVYVKDASGTVRCITNAGTEVTA